MGHAGHNREIETPLKRIETRYSFRCINSRCGRSFSCVEKLYRCPVCTDLLDIVFEYPQPVDPEFLRRLFWSRRSSNHPLDFSGVWRYRELLPFDEADYGHVVTLGEGNTPLLEAPRSAAYAGFSRLRIKHLGWNPSGSFKDYGMTTASARLRSWAPRRWPVLRPGTRRRPWRLTAPAPR